MLKNPTQLSKAKVSLGFAEISVKWDAIVFTTCERGYNFCTYPCPLEMWSNLLTPICTLVEWPSHLNGDMNTGVSINMGMSKSH